MCLCVCVCFYDLIFRYMYPTNNMRNVRDFVLVCVFHLCYAKLCFVCFIVREDVASPLPAGQYVAGRER